MTQEPAGETQRSSPREGRKEGFPAEAKRAVYAAIFGRRTVRCFHPEPVPEGVLARLLTAAHRAPSVGFSQPWNFLLVRDPKTRGRIGELFGKAHRAEASLLDEPWRSEYLSLKLDSLSTAPLNLCVTCDPTRGGPLVANSTIMPEAGLYSACLAVENLLLAARAEGVGVDWVSLLDQAQLGASTHEGTIRGSKRLEAILARVGPCQNCHYRARFHFPCFTAPALFGSQPRQPGGKGRPPECATWPIRDARKQDCFTTA